MLENHYWKINKKTTEILNDNIRKRDVLITLRSTSCIFKVPTDTSINRTIDALYCIKDNMSAHLLKYMLNEINQY